MIIRDQLFHHIHEWSNRFNPETLSQEDAAKLRDVMAKHVFIAELMKALLMVNYDLIYNGLVNKSIEQLKELTTITGRILTYPQGNIDGKLSEYNSTRDYWEQQYHQFAANTCRIIEISTLANDGISTYKQVENKLNEKVSSVDSDIEKIKSASEEVEKMKSSISSLSEQATTLAQEVIVSKYSRIYEENAKEFNTTANLWMKYIVGNIVLIIAVAISLAIFAKNISEGYAVYTIIATKVIVFAALFMALNLFIKNYKTAKHNQIVNKQKQNALDSFDTFIKAANQEKDVKNQVLLEVTKMIFSAQHTGYGSVDDNDGGKIMDVVSSLMKMNKTS